MLCTIIEAGILERMIAILRESKSGRKPKSIRMQSYRQHKSKEIGLEKLKGYLSTKSIIS